MRICQLADMRYAIFSTDMVDLNVDMVSQFGGWHVCSTNFGEVRRNVRKESGRKEMRQGRPVAIASLEL